MNGIEYRTDANTNPVKEKVSVEPVTLTQRPPNGDVGLSATRR